MGTLFTGEYCPRGTIFTSEFCPRGTFCGGTVFTATTFTMRCEESKLFLTFHTNGPSYVRSQICIVRCNRNSSSFPGFPSFRAISTRMTFDPARKISGGRAIGKQLTSAVELLLNARGAHAETYYKVYRTASVQPPRRVS